jgi:NitT/TauT family transport system substrate-binding protein
MRWSLAKLAAAALLALSFGTAAHAQTKVVAAYGSTSIQNAPIWIARDLGFFKKHGLDVELVQLTGPRITAGLISGSAQFISSAASSPLLSVLAGSDAIVIGTMIERMPYDFVVKSGVNSFADLKGKVGAILLRGDLTSIGMHVLLVSQGINPEKDVTIIQAGTDAERIAAMISGSADFTVVQADFRTSYEKAGFKRLLNALDVPGTEFINSGILATRSFAKSNPAAVTAYLKALGDAMLYMHNNREESIKIVAKVTGRPPAEIDPHYDFYMKIMKRDPAFDVNVIKATIKGLASVTPEMKADADPARFYDASFTDAIVKEGYFKK